MVEDHPSEFPAPKAPMVEGLAQGGSAVAPLAVGALEEVALGAHRVAMEVLEEAALVGATEEAASVGAMEEAASEVAALVEAATVEAAMVEAASVEATSVEAASEEALAVDMEEMVAAFSPEMKK